MPESLKMIFFRSLHIYFVILVAVALLTSSHFAGGSNNAFGQKDQILDSIELTSYTNPKYDITMQYPLGWEKNQTDFDPIDRVTNIVTFLSPFEDSKDTWREGFDVYLDKIDYNANLDEYLQESLTGLEEYSDFELLSQNIYSTLSGFPAYELFYTYTFEDEDEGSNDHKIKAYEIGTLINNTIGYFIVFEAEEDQFDAYFPVVKQSINSLSIGKVSHRDDDQTTKPVNWTGSQTNTTKTVPGEFLNYTNPQVGIASLPYPKSYDIVDDTKEPGFAIKDYEFTSLVHLFSPLISGLDEYQDSMLIAVVSYDYSPTREDAKQFIDELIAYGSSNDPIFYELVESNYSDSIDGFPAYKAKYTLDLPPMVDAVTYGIPVGNKLFIVSSYIQSDQLERYNHIFDTILNSLDFEEPKSIPSSYNITRGTSDNITNKEFIELSLDEWKSDYIDVIVLVNQETENQSSKYVSAATEAVQKWSELLKEHSGNQGAWNFNVKTETGNLETVQPSNPNTIILELVSTPLDYNYCDDMLGFASAHPSATTKPVTATVLTSCSDGFQILDLPMDDVYSIALHEFAHTLGLGHAFNIDNDLMCSYDIYPNGEEKETCSAYETTGRVEPSENDVKALLYKYGNDGFSSPNRNLFDEGGLRPVFMVTGNFTTDLKTENTTSDLPPLSSDEMTVTNDDGDSETVIGIQYDYFYVEPMARPHYDEGMRLLQQGQYNQAIASFDKALNIQPELIEAIVNKGISYNMLGDYDLAIQTLDSALESDSNESSALREKGLVYTNMGNHEQAISFYDKALLIDSEDTLALNNKAFSLIELGKDEDALIATNKGLEIAPDDINLLWNKVMALVNLDNILEAKSTLDKMLEIDPNNEEALETKEYLEDL